MRYVPLADLLVEMFSDNGGPEMRARLRRGHTALERMHPELRQGYIRRNGPGKWSPVKDWLTTKVGTKCWYTEAEAIGNPLSVDHYRPVCDYWWLAFSADNYRVACSFANSPKHNELYDRVGGKHDRFPLLDPAHLAIDRETLEAERPLILDPCVEGDCSMVAFQADGRPVLNPAYALDPIAARRVDESKILLNLDHPDFNSKREQLCNEIADDVQTYEDLPPAAPSRHTVLARLEGRLAPHAPFSSAARYYTRLHRDHEWVEDLLNRVA